MTFAEFCKQVSKETGYPRMLIQEVMTTGVRVVVEELLTDKENAVFSIKGLFDIFLSNRHCRSHIVQTGKIEEYNRWVLRIKPSRSFKALINGKGNLYNMAIGCVLPLYPEEFYKTHKPPRGKKDKALQQLPVSYKVVDENKKKRNKLKKKLAKQNVLSKLPQEDE